MSRIGLMTLLVSVALVATAAEADQKGNKGNKSHDSDLNCPPGLAKKDPPCVPPGQAKNHATPRNPEQTIDDFVIFRPGEVLAGNYVILINPWIYRPDLNGIYVRFGDYLYLIDRDFAFVLDRIGPVSDWNWSWADTDFANCPPGLAKKDPPCVPPGQAKKGVTARTMDHDGQFDPYGIGDVLPDGYVIVIDPALYAENENATYVRNGDTIYRADSATGEVLDQIGPIGKLIE